MDSPDGGGTPVPPPWKAYTHERQRALERELQWLAEPRQQQMLQQLQQKEEEPMDEVGYFWWDAVGCFEEAARRQEEEDLDGDARARRSDWHVSCYSSVAPVIGYDASSITAPDIEDHDNCCWDEVGYFEREAEPEATREAARRRQEEDGDARAWRCDRYEELLFPGLAPANGRSTSSIVTSELEEYPLAPEVARAARRRGDLTGGSAAEADEVDREGLAAELEAAH